MADSKYDSKLDEDGAYETKSSVPSRGGGAGLIAETYRKILIPSITISDNSSEVFCVRFSPDGKYVSCLRALVQSLVHHMIYTNIYFVLFRFLAAGCGDGAIRVFNATTGRLAYNLQNGVLT